MTAVRKSTRRRVTRPGDNIFLDLGFPPAEAENLRIRSMLLNALQQAVRSFPTQGAAAARLGVTQPRVSDVVRGKIELFSIDMLVELLGRIGLHVDVRVRPTAA
jgi:predicted XRE-type DNA-binding protein